MRHFVSVRDYCGDFEPICLVKKQNKMCGSVTGARARARPRQRHDHVAKNNLRKRNFAERR